MKAILLSSLFLFLSHRSNACQNFSGVYADSSDRQNQQVWTQDGCRSVSIHTRITGDRYLGTVDLASVTWNVGSHRSPAPMKTLDNYKFEGFTFVTEHIGYETENGVACTDRHIYSRDELHGLVQRNIFFCGGEVILDTTGTTPHL